MRPVFNKQNDASPSAIQDEVLRFTQQLGDVSTAKILRRIAIGTTETMVAHGLGGKPLTWLAGGPSLGMLLSETKPADEKFLYLIATVAVTVDLVVF
jgi:hypothetical protein